MRRQWLGLLLVGIGLGFGIGTVVTLNVSAAPVAAQERSSPFSPGSGELGLMQIGEPGRGGLLVVEPETGVRCYVAESGVSCIPLPPRDN